jgi:hypothetical protein
MQSKHYKQLISNQLEIDFVEVKLTQRTSCDSQTYQGVGSVYQQENGDLELKLYYRYPDVNAAFGRVNSNSHVEVGKVINDEKYFDLVATDMSGDIWTSERVYISDGSISFPSVGKVLKIKLESIKSVGQHEKLESLKDVSEASLIFPGKYKVPFNKYTDHKTGSTLNKLEFILDRKFDMVIGQQASKVSCVQHENHLQINLVAAPEILNKDLIEKLRLVFEILLGQLCQKTMLRLMEYEQGIIEIHSFDKSLSNRKLAEPIRSQSIVNYEGFQKCITGMMHYYGSFNIIHGYWHKVNRAYQGSIENAALALTVSVEGILKEFYRDFGQPAETDLRLFNESKQVINDLKIDQSIKDRLMSSIGHMKSFNARKALKNLTPEKLISKQMIRDWQVLRNKSAHADRLSYGEENIQDYLDTFYCCLTLFYRLVLMEVGYVGNSINYAEKGWKDAIIYPLKRTQVVLTQNTEKD